MSYPRPTTKALRAGVQLGALLAVAAVPTLAEAAGGHGHTPQLSDLVYPWINFAIYVALVTYLVAPRIRPAWLARRARIAAEIKAARDELAQAKDQLGRIQKTVATFDLEATTIRDSRAKQVEQQCAKIVADADAKAAWIRKSAGQLVNSERKSAVDAVREEIVKLALDQARHIASTEATGRFSTYGQAALDRVDELTVH